MEAAGKPLALLVNPSSGGGKIRTLLPKVEHELDLRRIPFRVERTESAEHAIAEALTAADAGEVPVVMSGDGLIGAVGGALAGSGTALGMIPGGRGNDLARVLGIPTDPASAVEVLAAGETREIDVGEANGQRFLGIASVGFESEANRIANNVRLVRGHLVYAYAALRALITWKPARFSLRVGVSGCGSPAARCPPPTARHTGVACSSPPMRTWPTASSTSCWSATSGGSAS